MKKLLQGGVALVLLFSLVGAVCAGGEDAPNDGPTLKAAAEVADTVVSLDADDHRARPMETAGRAPDKWALLVGINEYASEDITDLKGAVNDIERMKALLMGKFAFPEKNIKVLTNEQATHEGIVTAFQDHLINHTKRGDIVVFHYSGHGSQMRDQPDGDEADGMDESIVPHDSRQAGKYDISDDEINGLLRLLAEKTDNITLIFDSCHSGTASRGGGLARNAKPDDREPPPMPDYAVSSRGGQATSLRDPQINYVLLSGARSDHWPASTSTRGSTTAPSRTSSPRRSSLPAPV
ncbi:MAG: caspase family protein [Gemmatimonadetes bacterium]|nr:caspase family protein [Gemmatimonadota bacterium]